MNLSIRGEGVTIVLLEIFKSLSKSNKSKAFVSLLALIGVSFLMGDGVITPAISILSAVEETAFIPGFEGISQLALVFIAILIAFFYFFFRKREQRRSPQLSVQLCVSGFYLF